MTFMTKPKTVDEYIEGAPSEIREKLKQVRNAIRTAAPKAQEKISYGMPYYHYKGRLAYFGYAREHVGFYAMPNNLKKHLPELKKYSTATATIRLPLNEKIPESLIKKMVRFQIKVNDAKHRSSNK